MPEGPEAARSTSANPSLYYAVHGRTQQQNPKRQLTGGEARWEAELLLELLPDPELGYEGTGTGGAARRIWVSVHHSFGDMAASDCSQHRDKQPPCTGTSSVPKPMIAQPPRYTWP